MAWGATVSDYSDPLNGVINVSVIISDGETADTVVFPVQEASKTRAADLAALVKTELDARNAKDAATSDLDALIGKPIA